MIYQKWILPFLFALMSASAQADQQDFRNYDAASDRVKNFYKEQHAHQTLDFAKRKQAEYGSLNHGKYSLWEVIEILNKMVDESDPDLELPQIQHAMQTAEALRKDGQPDWFVLTGLIHDLGKMLAYFGEPQWAVVGDTYPLGCAFSPKIVYPETFQKNPDSTHPIYSTRLGIYANKTQPVGLDNVIMAWGHDEYLYQVVKNQSTLPEEAKFIIRYHSFYALHKENDYDYLLNDSDRKKLPWVKKFNEYDLYSKSSTPLDVEALKPYYVSLISKYFPNEKINW